MSEPEGMDRRAFLKAMAGGAAALALGRPEDVLAKPKNQEGVSLREDIVPTNDDKEFNETRPMLFLRFCDDNSRECPPYAKGSSDAFEAKGDGKEELVLLKKINNEVNESIKSDPSKIFDPKKPEMIIDRKTGKYKPELLWQLNPSRGNCADYAVTKRHELIKAGWPPRALRLAEVEIAPDEHHLILVARIKIGGVAQDYVLDNLFKDRIVLWSETKYGRMRTERPIKIQSQKDIRHWQRILTK